LRSTRCGCYKCAMGTEGLSGRAVLGGRGGSSAVWRRIAILTVSLAILPLAAGCSGSSLPSFGSSNPQSQPASVPPPPNASAAPAGQQAYAPPSSQPAAPATAAPAAQQDYSALMPYPKQSLADVFRDSTQPQGQTVPRPPSTYTPSGQPYTPQGQAGGTASVAAAPPASPDTPNMLAYPKQSLFEVMSNK
jgi:hypothetical protein